MPTEIDQPDSPTGRPEGKPERATLGLELAEPTDLLRQQFGLAKNVKGVLVVGMHRRSPAADANVRVGDVIVQINQQAVTTVADVKRLVNADPDDTILLLLNRRGQNLFVAVNRAD